MNISRSYISCIFLFLLLLLLPMGNVSAEQAKIDPQALALLQKVQDATQKTQSLTADFVVIFRTPGSMQETGTAGSVTVRKPNYLREEDWDIRGSTVTGVWKKQGAPLMEASDGNACWRAVSAVEYQRDKADPHGRNVYSANMPTYDFFDPAYSVLASVRKQQATGKLLALTCTGVERWDGHRYRVIDWKYAVNYPFPADVRRKVPGGVVTERERLYIGGSDLVYRVVETSNVGWSDERDLRHVRVNPLLTAANFRFTLPPGASVPKPPPPLLAAGTPAPDFTAVAPDGSLVHLFDLRGKTVVLDFWATWCGPCQMSMPHLEKFYESAKDKGVAVLGVCVWDKRTEYDKWVAGNKRTYTFPTAFDPAGRGAGGIASALYHVSSIPTQYVIDKDGTVVATTVGYDEGGTEMEAALKKLIAAAAAPPVSAGHE